MFIKAEIGFLHDYPFLFFACRTGGGGQHGGTVVMGAGRGGMGNNDRGGTGGRGG